MVQAKAKIHYLLKEAAKQQASDIHIKADRRPFLRTEGELQPVAGEEKLSAELAEEMIYSICTQEQKEIIRTNRELDFSYDYEGLRFRINAYFQKDTLAAAFRLIPAQIKSIEELNLPEICHQFGRLKQGLVLVTGPTGHGKSTTIASILEEINQQRAAHIITVEDPIEFVFKPKKSLVSQRELRRDTHSWQLALRSVLREDPNVVFVGEMRDLDTISSALTIAETGHLVFSTLHTNSAAQTIDRIVDVFPKGSRDQVRLQFSSVLAGVVSQRLLPSLSDGRIPATEIMLASTAVKTSIRDGKTHLIDNIIQTSREMGMRSLERSLAVLVEEGQISLETAQDYALRPEELLRKLGRA